MPDERRRSSTPWIVAAVLAVVVAGLVIGYVALKSYKDDHHDAGALTSNEKAAVAASRTNVAHLLGFRRAHFEQDFAAALAGATGPLKTDIQSRRATILKTITDGKFDLVVQVTHAALVGPAGKSDDGSSYVVLVTTLGYPSTSKTNETLQNLKVTVQKIKGTWLLSDVVNVGLA